MMTTVQKDVKRYFTVIKKYIEILRQTFEYVYEI